MIKRILEHPLGFPLQIVPAGRQASFVSTPSVEFTITRLIIPQSVGDHLVLEEVWINQANVLSKSKPAFIFGELTEPFEAMKVVDGWPRIKRNTPVKLVLRSTSNEPMNVCATLIGTIVS
jgi:hypothetical protein